MKKISKKLTTSRTTSKKTKKQFLYNPKNPSKSLDLFSDENPNDTIHIKYTTLDDVKTTITKLEKLYKNKKYPHKRITQVAMIMKIRLEYLKNNKPEQYNLANKYYKFLGIRTKQNDIARYKLIFRY
jgi:hypothetical protein